MPDIDLPGYAELLEQVKSEVQAARTRAALAVNRELVELYWRLGRLILDRQGVAAYGARVIDRLAADLSAAFPGVRGFGRRNLHYMRSFAEMWPEIEVVQRLVAQLPWGHNVELLAAPYPESVRLWYAEQAIGNGWSRGTLASHISSRLHLRSGVALTNFASSLPVGESDIVQQLIKDPYQLGFLGVSASSSERILENALVAHVERFLLELGEGFAFVGRQFPLRVGTETFFVDLLFFHIPTKRYVVVELKRSAFTPEALGKLNFYVNVVDDQLRTEHEAATIGLLLCRTHTEVVVRYALSGVTTPMAIAGYTLADLPQDAQSALPVETLLLNVVATTDPAD